MGLFLLFLRFLPVIAISEVKGVLPQSDPHFRGEDAFTHDAEGNAYAGHAGAADDSSTKEPADAKS